MVPFARAATSGLGGDDDQGRGSVSVQPVEEVEDPGSRLDGIELVLLVTVELESSWTLSERSPPARGAPPHFGKDDIGPGCPAKVAIFGSLKWIDSLGRTMQNTSGVGNEIRLHAV